jgi:hypothetical protein
MKKLAGIILALTVILCLSQKAFSQYPHVPPPIQKQDQEMIKKDEDRTDSIFNSQLSVLKEWERKGKPYVPWASRPTDLPQASIPAFPGAEGGGMYTFGGRGGKVYVVTSLADSGPGTLRWACEQVGPRIVVFNVSGIIHLKTPIIVKAPYISIEGQSAPGDGICVAGRSFWVNTHDVIIRYMRFRRGITDVGDRDDALGGNPVGNVIVDHTSTSWGLDENFSMYRHMYNNLVDARGIKMGTVNITIQNCISSEGLDTYNHAFGSTMGGENCTLVRNLWADNTARNPSIGWNGVFNFANNVIFNWGHRSVDGGDYTALYNIINNYYKPGPATDKGQVSYRILEPQSGRSKLPYVTFGRCYVHGNIVSNNEAVTKNNWNGGVQLENVKGNLMTLDSAQKYFPYIKVEHPFPMAPVKIMPTEEAYQYVLAHAGATLPHRDPVDIRIIKQVRTGKIDYLPNIDYDTLYQFKYRRLPKDSYKVGIITNIVEVGGYPKYEGTPRKDSDHDGIPDAWEIRFGLNPHDPSDATKLDKNGDYTYLEDYLNGVDPNKKVNWKDLKNNVDVLTETIKRDPGWFAGK